MPVAREPLDPRISLWHWLAHQLRFLRESHGMTLDQVGALIGAARSTVSNIEAGRLRIDDKQAFKLDRHYDTGFLLQLLLHYARAGHDPEWFKQFSLYESMARVIKIYGAQAIPIPFQTESYIRAIFAESPRVDVEEVLAIRTARQEALLNREDGAWFWLLLDEAALEIEVGSRATMIDQLNHLRVLGELSTVSVRIVPKSAGWHPGHDGPFRLISLESRDVAYAGAQRGGRLIEAIDEVRELAIDFDRIGQRSLTANDSRARIDLQIGQFS